MRDYSITAGKRAIEIMKSLIANIEDGNGITENANRASLLIRFLIRRGLKQAPFELQIFGLPSIFPSLEQF